MKKLSKRKQFKLTISVSLIALMLSYIGIVFYLSEPSYIDNCHKPIERYDWVAIPYGSSYSYDGNIKTGVVLQRSDSAFIMKVNGSFRSELYNVAIYGGQYKIIGEGTIYHKVNDYVGMNIMMVTQILIGVLCGILIVTTSFSIAELLED